MPTTEKLQTAFASALALPAGTDYSKVEYGKTSGWDSVAHMTLVAELESTFDIMLDTDDVIALSSYLEAERILAKYGVTIEG